MCIESLCWRCGPWRDLLLLLMWVVLSEACLMVCVGKTSVLIGAVVLEGVCGVVLLGERRVGENLCYGGV